MRENCYTIICLRRKRYGHAKWSVADCITRFRFIGSTRVYGRLTGNRCYRLLHLLQRVIVGGGGALRLGWKRQARTSCPTGSAPLAPRRVVRQGVANGGVGQAGAPRCDSRAARVAGG